MVNFVFLDSAGHKVARRITNRQEYFDVRNTAANIRNFEAARGGDDNAKRKLVQFNYNDQLPDGVLAGCCTASSTFSHDIDCRDENECKTTAQSILLHKEELGLLELTVSPNWGLHAVCRRELGKTILENQIRFSLLTQAEMDCNAHDLQRIFFTGPADEETLLFLDDRIFEEPLSVEEGQQEYLRLKQREENGEEELPAGYKKGEKHYRPWLTTEATEATDGKVTEATEKPEESEATEAQKEVVVPMVFGCPAADFINNMLPDGAAKGQRHNTMLRLANDLIIMLDNNEKMVKQALMQVSWVRDVVRERGEREIDNIVDSAKKLLKKRESETFYPLRPSKAMVAAIEELTHQSYSKLLNSSNVKAGNKSVSDEQAEMLFRMGKRIEVFCRHFPLLKLMCHRRKLFHYVAALFVGGGFCTTLMTRCWYKFYPSPGRKCRLNSLVMLIGRPGSGKHFAVDLYDLLMEPIKKADQAQIDALNDWNQEREKNNGSKSSTSARPANTYRCLPAESSTAALREAMFNAKEMIDGEEWPLHVSIFDSELNNTLNMMKKAHLDAFKTVWLKSFHNEAGGALLKTSSSPVGEFPIHFNAVYTGTYDAFEQLATEATYNSGTSSRFVCIPMAASCFEMLEFRQYSEEDKKVEEQLREWAYKLDATAGEIPSDKLSKALYQWTSRKMDEAREEQSEVLEEMCKRPAWVGINFALPFIVSRHWGEMIQDENGKFRCGAGFKLDKKDIELAVFLAQAHFDFQQYFFFALGQQQHDKQAAKVAGRKPQSRMSLSFKRLPEIFTSSDVMREYGYENHNSVNSRLKRLQDDGKIKKIRSGEDKGKYRKVG